MSFRENPGPGCRWIEMAEGGAVGAIQIPCEQTRLVYYSEPGDVWMHPSNPSVLLEVVSTSADLEDGDPEDPEDGGTLHTELVMRDTCGNTATGDVRTMVFNGWRLVPVL